LVCPALIPFLCGPAFLENFFRGCFLRILARIFGPLIRYSQKVISQCPQGGPFFFFSPWAPFSPGFSPGALCVLGRFPARPPGVKAHPRGNFPPRPGAFCPALGFKGLFPGFLGLQCPCNRPFVSRRSGLVPTSSLSFQCPNLITPR